MTRSFTTLACAAALALAGCGSLPQVTAAAGATVSQAQADVQAAINLYQITLGVAEVAAGADPAIGPAVTAVTAALGPKVAQAQAALNDATVDANALEALASAIVAQSNALMATSAPAVRVVPSS